MSIYIVNAKLETSFTASHYQITKHRKCWYLEINATYYNEIAFKNTVILRYKTRWVISNNYETN